MSLRTFLLTVFLAGLMPVANTASADTFSYFTFDEVPVSKGKKSNSAAEIESYLEGIYGSEVTVGPLTKKKKARVKAASSLSGKLGRSSHLGNSDGNSLGALAPSSLLPDTFLMAGKGKNPTIAITFEEAPINSFAVDWQLFTKAQGLTIKADGVVIFELALTKAEKKVGMLGYIDPFYFDDPVHTLEFIGWKKSKFGIDNLVVDFPTGEESTEPGLPGDTPPGPIETALVPPPPIVTDILGSPVRSIPQPAPLILLSLGLVLIVAHGCAARFRRN